MFVSQLQAQTVVPGKYPISGNSSHGIEPYLGIKEVEALLQQLK
jgi:hypothetical protein